jgi:hypothetical protein
LNYSNGKIYLLAISTGKICPLADTEIEFLTKGQKKQKTVGWRDLWGRTVCMVRRGGELALQDPY